MDESTQSSTASLESRLESGQDSSDQSPPGLEGRSKESPDSSCNRKQSLSADGFCDNRGREVQVPDAGRAHDGELESDLVPVTMNQGSTVAALADFRPQTDKQEGEVLNSIASCPDIVDGGRDHFGEQPAFQAPSTPLAPTRTMRAQPTGQQPVQQPVQQSLSHQTELQAHAQHPSAQTGAYNHQLRSPIPISFASSDKTHRVLRRRRRKGRGDAGKPEGIRCCKAGVAHVGYPPSQRPGRFTPGKQAARTERPSSGHGYLPSGVYTDSQLRDAAQIDRHTAQVSDMASHGLKHEPLPSQTPPANTPQSTARNWYGSRVFGASRALREQQLPPIYNSGHDLQTPVLANIQPQPQPQPQQLGGGPPPGHRSTMHQGQYQTEFLGSRSLAASRAFVATPMASPRSEAYPQYTRPCQISTLDPNCALCSASAPADLLQQYTAAVIIEDDVFIGGNVAIMPGCIIGKGSVVEAGSVVIDNVPPFTIVSGTPARVLGGNYTSAL